MADEASSDQQGQADPPAPQGPPTTPVSPPAPSGGPVLSAVVPARGPVAGGTTLRLLGSGLKPPQSITVGGAEVTGWTVVSDGEIQVTSPPGVAGPVDIVVTVGGAASTGPAQRFEYLPAPVIHAAKVHRRRIQVHGDHLTPTLGVTVGGAAPAEVEAHGGMLSILPAAGPTGDVPVTVQTDGGTSNAYLVSIPAGWTRPFCFWLALVYFAMLLALLITYKTIGGFHERFPGLPGNLPPAIPWFGALGAVALSLAGVTYHSAKRDWDQGYLLWHAVRPVMGAVFGTVAYFIIAGGVLASGGSPSNGATATGGSVPKNLFYIVLAFIVGWREATFRSLLQRVSDVIFAPGNSSGSSGGGSGSAGKDGGAPASGSGGSDSSAAASQSGAAAGSGSTPS